jgi:hypothetical protein
LGGSNSCEHYFRKSTAESCKSLVEWPVQCTQGTFHLPVASSGDPRCVRCSHFLVRILPLISFFPVDLNQRQGINGRSEAGSALVGPICSFVFRHRPYFGRGNHKLIASCVPNKIPVRDFCWRGRFVCLCVCVSVCTEDANGSLEVAARAARLQFFLLD